MRYPQHHARGRGVPAERRQANPRRRRVGGAGAAPRPDARGLRAHRLLCRAVGGHGPRAQSGCRGDRGHGRDRRHRREPGDPPRAGAPGSRPLRALGRSREVEPARPGLHRVPLPVPAGSRVRPLALARARGDRARVRRGGRGRARWAGRRPLPRVGGLSRDGRRLPPARAAPHRPPRARGRPVSPTRGPGVGGPEPLPRAGPQPRSTRGCTGRSAAPPQEAGGLAALYEAIHNLGEKRAALCLSGGGIRSATFALGVLQGLARLKRPSPVSLPLDRLGRRLYRGLADRVASPLRERRGGGGRLARHHRCRAQARPGSAAGGSPARLQQLPGAAPRPALRRHLDAARNHPQKRDPRLGRHAALARGRADRAPTVPRADPGRARRGGGQRDRRAHAPGPGRDRAGVGGRVHRRQHPEQHDQPCAGRADFSGCACSRS